MSANTIYLDIDLIRTDGGTQSRACLNQETINDYADLLERDSWNVFPPIRVFYDGTHYWLADGFHRLAAYKKLNIENIECIVSQGTVREAILFSVGANAKHGLPRSPNDKRRAVETMLNDEEWCNWSDNQIAKQCIVSQPFVSALRKELQGDDMPTTRRAQRNGKDITMRTEKIGKTKEEPTRNPNTKEMFEGEQPSEQSEPSYNVISEKQKVAQLEKQVKELTNENALLKADTRLTLEKQLNQDEENLKQFNSEFQLIDFTKQIAELIGFSVISDGIPTNQEILSKLKEIVALKDKVNALTETNNQLFSANENLAKELTRLESANKELKTANENLVNELKDSAQRETDLENQLENVRLINEDIIELRKSNKNLKYQVSTLAEENKSIKESRDRLKLRVTPNNSNQLENILKEVKSIFEISLNKRKEIRLGKAKADLILNDINQALGAEG